MARDVLTRSIMHRLGSAVLSLSLLVVPAVAHAQDDDGLQPLPAPPAGGATHTVQVVTIDSVHLRNGTLYRGHVAEIVPGDHVTIKTEAGETKRIAWNE